MLFRSLSCAVVLVATAALAACHEDSCLEGTCPRPCAALAFTCAAQPLYAGPVANAPASYRLARGAGAGADTLISNGIVTAVIADPAGQLDLAPTGGTLIDLGPAGGLDDVTLVYQLAGILPDDAFAYRTLDVQTRADRVTVTVRGRRRARVWTWRGGWRGASWCRPARTSRLAGTARASTTSTCAPVRARVCAAPGG